jgi:hypothetical protein
MSSSITPAIAGPLPAGHYAVQLLAKNDPPPSGRFAVERVACRKVDERVQAEFAICAHIDSLNRDLRTNDRVHVLQRHRGQVRNLVRRVEIRGGSVLLHPLRGRKTKALDASCVAVLGLVTGTYTQFRV